MRTLPTGTMLAVAGLVIGLLGTPTLAGDTAAAETLHSLCYHDVRDHVARNFDPDEYAVSTENLASHFSWLQTQAYTVVGTDEVIAARNGGKPLPPNAVMLTFDDGFRSVYTHVFPLLKLFGYKAVISIVTSWIESDTEIVYNERILTRDDFLTWAQLREMQASGLVEIASHTHAMHQGVPGNPQGNTQPAAITRIYLNGHYEDEQTYLDRIEVDLVASIDAIRRNTGSTPRVITWPFGAWNEPIRQLAENHGMVLSLTLGEQKALGRHGTIGRDMLVSNPDISQFAPMFGLRLDRPVRAAQVDLDYIYDPDPVRQEANLGLLLDRMQALEISHVYLQAFADPDGDGSADALYFPNRHLPMRADLFNRVAWQLATRSHVRVFAWMPVLGYTWPDIDPAWQVLEAQNQTIRPDQNGEPRLSPYRPEARALILDIYEDLAVHANFAGLHFHDDGRMNQFEDANPDANAAYREAFGADFDMTTAASDPELAHRWASFKARTLIELTREITEVTRRWRPDLKTSRNLFASALLDDDAILYLAQNFNDFLASYDLVTVMAMPGLEEANDADAFYRDLIEVVYSHADGPKRTVFQLQAYDWHRQEPISAGELRDTMRFLQSQGIRNLAYYPDDFIRGKPELETLKQGISLAEFPWRPGS
ncbi:MAG: poly-beta-1,6-N-acetyl-D-glucosamine N-deacetylase PgaB [Gammaproteobacteria bacterium]|nr:MAG: poly-beta-1,6-N-acetyl-D-glucosamine N-deacetylase PgaB [Gammaproteobacteria bacterium]